MESVDLSWATTLVLIPVVPLFLGTDYSIYPIELLAFVVFMAILISVLNWTIFYIIQKRANELPSFTPILFEILPYAVGGIWYLIGSVAVLILTLGLITNPMAIISGENTFFLVDSAVLFLMVSIGVNIIAIVKLNEVLFRRGVVIEKNKVVIKDQAPISKPSIKNKMGLSLIIGGLISIIYVKNVSVIVGGSLSIIVVGAVLLILRKMEQEKFVD
ncbi:MAG: hypothetical protein QXL15_02720 [Candidatus Korarchaeota archaeon]